MLETRPTKSYTSYDETNSRTTRIDLILWIDGLTHCGLVKPCRDIELGQHWLTALILSEVLCHSPEGNCIEMAQDIHPWYLCLKTTTYHGYAMRKTLLLCRKTVTFKSKGFLCLFGHNSRIHCFWLKNLNLFSQNITFSVMNYLNFVEKIILEIEMLMKFLCQLFPKISVN